MATTPVDSGGTQSAPSPSVSAVYLWYTAITMSLYCLLASNVCYRTLNTTLIATGFLLALPLSLAAGTEAVTSRE